MKAHLREFRKRVIEAGQSGALNWTEVRLLEVIINLTEGRLKGCIARVRVLAERIGRGIRHTRRLLQKLEERGWIIRHERRLEKTSAQISNLIQIGGLPLPEIKWQETQPDGSASMPAPPQGKEEMHRCLEKIISHAQAGATASAREAIRKYYASVENHPLFQQYLRYYQCKRNQGKQGIACIKAYIETCNKRFGAGNMEFWKQYLDYISPRDYAIEVATERDKQIVAGGNIEPGKEDRMQLEENIFNTIGKALPARLQEQMREFYRRRMQR